MKLNIKFGNIKHLESRQQENRKVWKTKKIKFYLAFFKWGNSGTWRGEGKKMNQNETSKKWKTKNPWRNNK